MKKDTSVVTDDFTPGAGGALMPIRNVLGSKAGFSVSLPEILVALGITIAALGLGGGIAATMNFSKDSNAQQTLDSVKAAETLIQNKSDAFGDIDALTAGDTPAYTSSTDNLKIAASDTQYCAVVKSKSMAGTSYWLTAKSGTVLKEAPTAAEAGIACPTL